MLPFPMYPQFWDFDWSENIFTGLGISKQTSLVGGAISVPIMSSYYMPSYIVRNSLVKFLFQTHTHCSKASKKTPVEIRRINKYKPVNLE